MRPGRSARVALLRVASRPPRPARCPTAAISPNLESIV